MVSLNRDSVTEKILEGARISTDDALELYRWPLEEIAALANARRDLAKAKSYGGRGREIVTYIVDRNINYTNVCNVYCKFCAFYRTERDEDHYVLSLEQLDQKLDELTAAGGVQILMQGGHHPKLVFQWYIDLLQHIREKYPHINIHGFSPPEFQHFAETFRMPLREVISQFKDGWPRLDPGRWRRNPGGPCAETDFAFEMQHRRMAGGDAGGARARIKIERHDDVRPRGDDRRSRRTFAADSRSTGSKRRIHCVHLLDLSAAAHGVESEATDWRVRISANAGAGTDFPG